MNDLPENLQIKRELSPPFTPEDKSLPDIKAKLNLHVKRRLQDVKLSQENTINFKTKGQVALVDIKQESPKFETIRKKRPYNKRIDMNKFTETSNSILLAPAVSEATTPQRKYKHKIKQIVAIDNQDVLARNSVEENVTVDNNTTITADVVSAGDEDDGGQENELKASREKEKYLDVLAIVLNIKKRALIQEPEVNNFLKEVMEVIRS